jgi:hypothetical protein
MSILGCTLRPISRGDGWTNARCGGCCTASCFCGIDSNMEREVRMSSRSSNTVFKISSNTQRFMVFN